METAQFKTWRRGQTVERGTLYRPDPDSVTVDGKPMSAKATFDAFVAYLLDPYSARECQAPTSNGVGVGPDGKWMSRDTRFDTLDGEKTVWIHELHPTRRFEAFRHDVTEWNK